MLWNIGFPPLVLDLVPAPELDDDHVLALYQVEGHWGAAAKSNFVQLGFREPVYRDFRELSLSYFEHYMNLSKLDPSWMWDEASANRLYKKFYTRKSIPLITKSSANKLNLVRLDVFKAETLGTNMDWVFGKREG